jgi:hypothetical protein
MNRMDDRLIRLYGKSSTYLHLQPMLAIAHLHEKICIAQLELGNTKTRMQHSQLEYFTRRDTQSCNCVELHY